MGKKKRRRGPAQRRDEWQTLEALSTDLEEMARERNQVLDLLEAGIAVPDRLFARQIAGLVMDALVPFEERPSEAKVRPFIVGGQAASGAVLGLGLYSPGGFIERHRPTVQVDHLPNSVVCLDVLALRPEDLVNEGHMTFHGRLSPPEVDEIFAALRIVDPQAIRE